MTRWIELLSDPRFQSFVLFLTVFMCGWMAGFATGKSLR